MELLFTFLCSPSETESCVFSRSPMFLTCWQALKILICMSLPGVASWVASLAVCHFPRHSHLCSWVFVYIEGTWTWVLLLLRGLICSVVAQRELPLAFRGCSVSMSRAELLGWVPCQPYPTCSSSGTAPFWWTTAPCIHLHQPEIRVPLLTPLILSTCWIFLRWSPVCILQPPQPVLCIPTQVVYLNHTSFPVIPLTNSLPWSTIPLDEGADGWA